MCFVLTLSRYRDKLSPRAVPGVFLGYPFGIKGYKILTLHSKQILISRDVKFVEYIFPFSISKPLSQLFPISCPLPHEEEPATSPLPPLNHIPTPPLISTSSLSPSTTEDSTVLSTPQEPQLRRSTREHHAPTYLSDYICANYFSVISLNPHCFPLRYHTFSTMNTHNQSLLTSICQITEPTSYQQAILHPD